MESDHDSSSSSSSSWWSSWLIATLGKPYVEIREQVEEMVRAYSTPTTTELLPPLHMLYPEHIQPLVRTLVVDLEGVLTYSNFKRERGWATYKRPGVDKFLEGAFNLGWEVVLYTEEDHMTAEQVGSRG